MWYLKCTLHCTTIYLTCNRCIVQYLMPKGKANNFSFQPLTTNTILLKNFSIFFLFFLFWFNYKTVHHITTSKWNCLINILYFLGGTFSAYMCIICIQNNALFLYRENLYIKIKRKWKFLWNRGLLRRVLGIFLCREKVFVAYNFQIFEVDK